MRDFEKKRREPIANNKAAIERALCNAGIGLVADKEGNPIGIEHRYSNRTVTALDDDRDPKREPVRKSVCGA